MKPFTQKLEWLGANLASLFVILGLSITVATIVWSSSRGFDITDNGYYFLVSNHPEDVKAALSFAHLYTALIFKAVNGNIATFRISSAVLIILSSSILALACLKFTRATYPDASPSGQFTSFLLVPQGALLFFSFNLIAPSYNVLNISALLAGFGAVLLSLVIEGNSQKQIVLRCVLSFFAGICAGVSFFSKFPTAIVLASICIGLLLAWRGQIPRSRLVLAYFVGFSAELFAHFTVLQSFGDWLEQIKNGLRFVELLNAGHGIATLGRYAIELCGSVYRSIMEFFGAYLVLVVMPIVVRAAHLTGRTRDTAIGGGVLVALFYIAVRGASLDYYIGGDPSLRTAVRLYIALLGVTVLALLVNWQNFRRPNISAAPTGWQRTALLGAALGFLPFAGILGTGIPLPLSLMLHIAPWFALIPLLWIILESVMGQTKVFVAGAIILSAFSSTQSLTAGEWNPYRLNMPSSLQTESTRLGEHQAEVLLDPDTKYFFEHLKAMARENGFAEGDDILAFFNMPGVVFALGGRSPGGTWFNAGYSGDTASNAFLLSLTRLDRIRNAFLLLKGSPDKVKPLLGRFGIQFPQDYIYCGKVFWPVTGEFVSLWKAKGQVRETRN